VRPDPVVLLILAAGIVFILLMYVAADVAFGAVDAWMRGVKW